MIIPGVQMPHCGAAVIDERALQPMTPAERFDGLTRAPAACASGTRHELTGAPSRSTVQPPHSPSRSPLSCR